MNPVYPIEQLATGTPPDFVRRAYELLAGSDEIAVEAAHDGLRLLAHAEPDLDAPRRRLRDVFGDAVRFAPPDVRLLYAGGWQQPIMGFRIVADPLQFRQVEASLARRAAEIADVELRPGSGVIRGQAPLAALLGYPRTLRRLGGDAAHATLWLSHYRPLWSYASETMACYPG